jgi:cyanophycinase
MTEERSGNGRRRDDEGRGRIVLIGGACDPLGDALGAFIRLSGAAEGGKVVGLTTASSDPAASARSWKRDLKRAGAIHVEIPIVPDRNTAQNRELARLIRSADGIFLGGGDQIQLVSTIGGSRLERAIREAHAGGAVVCGTSAGSAALTETIMAGGEAERPGGMAEEYIGPGFGLVGFHATIDTHFAERLRLQRLFSVIARNPELMGLGIDEDTALVVKGHLGDVVGSGSVTFVDGRGVRFDNAEDVQRGHPLTLSYLRVGVIGSGYTFNLRERELQVILDKRAVGEESLEFAPDEP